MSSTTIDPPFPGNGSPPGTPLFPVLDGATGDVAYVTAAQHQALMQPGALIQTTPADAPATAVSFAGPAGSQPTGTAAISPASEIAGLTWGPPALDGGGGLRFTAHYEYAVLTGLPALQDGSVKVTVAPGSTSRSMCILLHMDPILTDGYILAADNGRVVFQALGTATGTEQVIGSYTGTVETLEASIDGETLTLAVNGVVAGSTTSAATPGGGLVGFGSYDDPSPLVVASVTVQSSCS